MRGKDIRGSKSHVTMLAKQGIFKRIRKNDILKDLITFQKDIEIGTLHFTEDMRYS